MVNKDITEEEWKEYKGTNCPKIREKLIIRYAPIVKYVAGKMAIATPTIVEYDDLVSYGIIGLIDAIEKFDFKKSKEEGIQFKSYAIPRIKGAIIDELRLIDWLPRSMRRKMKRLEEAYISLEMRYNRPATDEEICEELGITKNEFNQMVLEFSGITFISLDEIWYIGEDEQAEVMTIDTIKGPEEQSPEVIIEKQEIQKRLAEAIRKLPEKEKEVIALYYYEDLVLKEIGEVLGFTESRICQLHAKAIIRLRASIKKDLQGFIIPKRPKDR
ncbi:FliA/WhiG family RNA polymerase sigma factor [bacterium]|nr:FliA/WhiG family RNA polymerase sigma factor [bacterium]MBU1599424.1 FliA/WhiG family RNA polymerase sigma factor [bacterium]